MMRLALIFAPLVILVALLVLFATNIGRDPEFVPSVLIDKPVPDMALDPIEGGSLPGFAPTDFAGQVTVVNVFASWCVPCRQEHPMLVALAAEGIPIFGINQKDAPENARAFLEELGNPYTRIGADPNGRASIEWGVYGVPETFVVNAEGTITYKHVGPISERSYRESVLPAIEAARNPSAQ